MGREERRGGERKKEGRGEKRIGRGEKSGRERGEREERGEEWRERGGWPRGSREIAEIRKGCLELLMGSALSWALGGIFRNRK